VAKNPFWSGFWVGSLLMALTVAGLWYQMAGIGDQTYDQLPLVDLTGKRVDVTQFAGRPLVVNYWATWCKPCIEEFKDFEEVRRRPGNKVAFLLISDDPLPKVVKFAASKKYSFVFGTSTESLKLGVRPITLFYNQEGKLTAKKTGAMDVTQLLGYLQEIEGTEE
jgi:thiol-disulfide isomerase/thioredoxin